MSPRNLRNTDNPMAIRKAAEQNIKSIEESQVSGIDPDIVDQIFEEFDDYASDMIEKWKDEAIWKDSDEAVKYLRLKRAAKREATLNKVVPDRKCPECGEIELRDSHWRVNKWHSAAICWDCFKSNYNYRTTNSQFYPGYDEWEIIQLIHNIFVRPVVRYHINPDNFRKIRAMLGITKKSMSRAMGVTPPAVDLIERGKIKTISREQTVECMKMYRRYFIKRLEEIGYDDVGKYKSSQTPIVEKVG